MVPLGFKVARGLHCCSAWISGGLMEQRQLVRWRRAAGLTQEQLAELLNVSLSTVRRWERGHDKPRPWRYPPLARVLKIKVADVSALFDGPPATVEPSQAPSAPTIADLTTVLELREAHLALSARYELVPSSELLAEGSEQLAHLKQLAKQSHSGRLTRDMLALQAETAILMGKIVWDASQRRASAAARAYYDQAARIGERLRDPAVQGHALLRSAYVELYGTRDAEAGLVLARSAATVAAPISPALAGLALLHAGEAHAMLRQGRECDRALGEAISTLETVDATDIASDLGAVDQVERLAGSCHLELGQHRAAQRRLEAAASSVSIGPKSRPIVLGNLARAAIGQGQLDGAVFAIGRAIDDLQTVMSGGGIGVVVTAVRELRPWRTAQEVQDVQDRLFDLMAAP
ncbi:helix-turn-helix domain-containing protein [Kitasatospora sp. NPDC056273]|uniref:helix-turn-helix domain-containing protein n=1 Tax=Kitasatospora sp. NPDC056273 TaxID=3345769 RepID=UPI0035DFCABF